VPTPTQVNTEDITDLKTSIQRLVDAVHLQEVTMERGFSRLDARIGQAESRLDARIGQIEKQIAVLGSEVRNVKGIGKWILGAVLTLLAGVGGAIWWASQIDYRVNQIEHNVQAPK
jgi:hypothetical protein